MSEYPYPGLRPFRQEESDIFFGREQQSDKLLEYLGQNHFVAIIGSSGCGKSSLVFAGLICGLNAGLLARVGVNWRIAQMRPGATPFDRLTEALLKPSVFGQSYGAQFSSLGEASLFLRATLSRGPLCLHELLNSNAHPLPVGEKLFILVDQFEEIFRYALQNDSDAEEAAAFVELLLESSRHPDIFVAITMRSDFLGDCVRFHGLPEAINRGLFLVPRMTREQLRDATSYPARVFGGKVEEALINRMLNDAGDKPDQLPLMQHCLMWMWSKALAENRDPIELRLLDYDRIGKLDDSLSRHADKAYDSLDETQKAIAQILFKALTDRLGGRQDMRRPTRLGDIGTLAGVAWQEVAAVVEVFRKTGRSFLTPDASIPLTPESMIDIGHESLIRRWERLKRWIEQEDQWVRQYRRVVETASEWRNGKAELWRRADLSAALAWVKEASPKPVWAERYNRRFGLEPDSFPLAMEFLRASRSRKQFIDRSRACLLALIFGGLIGTSLYLHHQWKIQTMDAERIKGFNHLASGSYKDALQAFENAIASCGDNQSDIQDGKGQALLALGRNQEAMDAFDTAIRRESQEKEPNPQNYYLNFARAAFQQNQYDLAQEKYEKIISDNKSEGANKARAYYGLVDVCIAKGQMQQAYRHFNQAKGCYQPKQKIELAYWDILRAENHIKFNENEEALKICDEISQNGSSWSLQHLLDTPEKIQVGTIYLKTGNSRTAITLFEHVLQQDPRNPEAAVNLGEAYLSLGSFYEAEQSFKNVVGILDNKNPACRARAFQGLGNIFMARGKLEDAIHAYEQALAYDEGKGYIYLSLASAFFQINKLKEARDYLDKVKSNAYIMEDSRLKEIVDQLQQQIEAQSTATSHDWRGCDDEPS